MDADEVGRGGEMNDYEVVMLFGADEQIEAELHFSDFESLLAGDSCLDAYASSAMNAAYCVIGNGLALRGVVYFCFKVDENGRVDAAFNVPLRYLVMSAGSGPDLGQGPIKTASRAQCPVPWHSVNLWEPTNTDAADIVQRRVYRNKLKLKSSTGLGSGMLGEPLPSGEIELVQSFDDLAGTTNPPRIGAVGNNVALEAKLTDTFGEAGKLSLQDVIRLHTQQLAETQQKYREDLAEHQQVYLDQIRDCKEEIHELKVALRREQSHNQRLQQMLRGDI